MNIPGGSWNGSAPGSKWERCLQIPWAYYNKRFLGFVQLACISLLLKQ